MLSQSLHFSHTDDIFRVANSQTNQDVVHNDHHEQNKHDKHKKFKIIKIFMITNFEKQRIVLEIPQH
jgi:hypothetical protein